MPSPFEEALLSPISQPAVFPSSRYAGVSKTNVCEEETPQCKKRASSMILPEDEPRLFTFTDEPVPPMPEQFKDEIPPAVPPKSPRTVMKLAPAVSASPPPQSHKKDGSTTQLNLPSTAAPTAISPNPFTSPWASTPHLAHRKAASAADGRLSPRTRPATSGCSPIKQTESRHMKQSSSSSNISPTDTSKQNIAFQHKREGSDTSIINRARPTKRIEGIIRKPMNKRRPSDDLLTREIPIGASISEATAGLSTQELDGIVRQAEEQAKRFAVLTPKETRQLSRVCSFYSHVTAQYTKHLQELRALDERCAYLRQTYVSLRAGRQNLHDRMIGFLRSPVASAFSRQNMLKQEVALAELDASIDDWWSRWELAENRRSRVRQKLLEHIAAATLLQQQRSTQGTNQQREARELQRPQSRVIAEPQTPPRSPETPSSPVLAPMTTSSPPTGVHKSESIKIYADTEVWALLADIEKEMEFMGSAWSFDQKFAGVATAV